MQIDKSQIIDMLKSQGDTGNAQQADQELPQQVDTEQHAGLLEKFGINPQDLIAKFAGGSGSAASNREQPGVDAGHE